DVPQSNALVVAARCQQLTVRMHRNGDNGFSMALELPKFLASLDIPQSDEVVPSGSGDLLAVQGKQSGNNHLVVVAKARLIEKNASGLINRRRLPFLGRRLCQPNV